MFYGSPSKLIGPGSASHMGDGWETARRRDDGNDWVIVALAAEGVIRIAELDTSYFLHNAPGWASLRGRVAGGGWIELLPRTRLQPDTRHRFRVEAAAPVDEVRLDIYPDGGMARLRLFADPTSRVSPTSGG
jgi:allantoicase